MLQNVINAIRVKLIPYIGVEEPFVGVAAADYYYTGGEKLGKIIRKIPPQNYEKLRRNVPIGWIK